MNNIETFFKVLEKMEQLENKKKGNKIRRTEIFIFKSNIGYSIYFGISNDNICNTYIATTSEEYDFKSTYYQKVFMPKTGIYLGTVSEKELNNILCIFIKKYSVTSFKSNETIISLRSNANSSIIRMSYKNTPKNIETHLAGVKNNHYAFLQMPEEERTSTINDNNLFSVNDYMTMLDVLNVYEGESYLKKAYALTYPLFMSYIQTKNKYLIKSNNQNNLDTEIISAEEFLSR